jgi:hypothetical protein
MVPTLVLGLLASTTLRRRPQITRIA